MGIGVFEFKLETKSLPDEQKVLTKYGLLGSGPVQQFIDSECLRRMDPLVPKDRGALINDGVKSTSIGSGKIVYTLPYARKQYYIPMNHSEGRTNYWFEHMKNNGGREAILKGAQKIAEQQGNR